MPLVDDLAMPLSEQELGRRKMLGVLGAGALVTAIAGTGLTTLRYLEPSVFYEEDTRFAVGRPEDIAPGTVLVLPRQKVYVIRTSEGFYALSSVCTHLGCMTRYERERKELACPCHGSHFTLDGQVAGGPAPRPLPRLALSIDRGLLVVDAAQHVAAGTILRVA